MCRRKQTKKPRKSCDSQKRHASPKAPPKPPVKGITEDPIVSCKLCDYKASTLEVVEHTLEAHKVTDKEGKLLCAFGCGKSEGATWEMRKHYDSNKHFDVRRHQCEITVKVFRDGQEDEIVEVACPVRLSSQGNRGHHEVSKFHYMQTEGKGGRREVWSERDYVKKLRASYRGAIGRTFVAEFQEEVAEKFAERERASAAAFPQSTSSADATPPHPPLINLCAPTPTRARSRNPSLFIDTSTANTLAPVSAASPISPLNLEARLLNVSSGEYLHSSPSSTPCPRSPSPFSGAYLGVPELVYSPSPCTSPDSSMPNTPSYCVPSSPVPWLHPQSPVESSCIPWLSGEPKAFDEASNNSLGMDVYAEPASMDTEVPHINFFAADGMPNPDEAWPVSFADPTSGLEDGLLVPGLTNNGSAACDSIMDSSQSIQPGDVSVSLFSAAFDGFFGAFSDASPNASATSLPRLELAFLDSLNADSQPSTNTPLTAELNLPFAGLGLNSRSSSPAPFLRSPSSSPVMPDSCSLSLTPFMANTLSPVSPHSPSSMLSPASQWSPSALTQPATPMSSPIDFMPSTNPDTHYPAFTAQQPQYNPAPGHLTNSTLFDTRSEPLHASPPAEQLSSATPFSRGSSFTEASLAVLKPPTPPMWADDTVPTEPPPFPVPSIPGRGEIDTTACFS